ncbi:MAG TPA: T9SS type A sorting domain-containing protein [Saprospiraceae bacterium]|nr:T9SS type A sorting domain-containing protein [Saprospiraceae bacterium]
MNFQSVPDIKVLILSLFIYLNNNAPIYSAIPNMIIKDTYGETHDLASYLDEGKSVILNFSSTWCKPCWKYEQTGILEHLWYKFGPLGSDEIVIILLEADAITSRQCISGMEGCNDFTYGNWKRKPYPVINLEGSGIQLVEAFEIERYPTIIGISSRDYSVQKLGQLTFEGWNNWINAQHYAIPGVSQEEDLEYLRRKLTSKHDPVLVNNMQYRKFERNREIDNSKVRQITIMQNLPQWTATELDNTTTLVEEDIPLRVKVFPNPCVDWIHIQYSDPDKQPAKAKLYTSSGRKIMEKHLPNKSQSLQLDVSRLKRGLYILEIEGTNVFKSEKLFVIR